MSRYKNRKKKDNLDTCNVELEFLMETLMTLGDGTPCEAGLYCPYYLDDPNAEIYCESGNCAKGMSLYAQELCAKIQVDK